MKISVVIPAYNAEKYIRKAIESCLEQTEPPDEIIVVDDASTDRTAEIAEGFGEAIRVIRLPKNGGVSIARNLGVEASTGDWIAFLDADDWFLPRKLELQRKCIQEDPDAVLVYSGHRFIPVEGPEREGSFIPPNELGWRLRYMCAFVPSCVLLSKSAFDATGGFDPTYRIAQDWDLWLRLADRYSTTKFAAVREPQFVFRRVHGSLSSSTIRCRKEIVPIINTRSLYQTTGLRREMLRERIQAFSYFDTAVGVREEGSSDYVGFVLKSLIQWPFPGKMLPLTRYKVAAVMLLQHIGLWPNPFRSNDPSKSVHHSTNGENSRDSLR